MRTSLATAKKKLEGDLQDLEDQVDVNSRARDEAIKQLRKIQVRKITLQILSELTKPFSPAFIFPMTDSGERLPEGAGRRSSIPQGSSFRCQRI